MKDEQMGEDAGNLRFGDRLWKRGQPTLGLPLARIRSPDVGVRVAEVEREKDFCPFGHKEGTLFFPVGGFDWMGEW